MSRSSRLPGFYKSSVEERLRLVAAAADLTDEESAILSGAAGLQTDTADHMIENVVGTHSLPLSLPTFISTGVTFWCRWPLRNQAWWLAPVLLPG
jgi:hydroxymethylglutaryl-CoA reductase